MRFDWSQDQLDLVADLEQFARDELSSDLVERDSSSTFDYELWKKCAGKGILGMAVPGSYAGQKEDVEPLSAALALETLGYASADNGLVFAMAAQMFSVEHPIAVHASETLADKYLPGLCSGELIGCYALTEEHSGSDHLSMQTIAEPTEGGYLISGTKKYVTLGPIADIAIVFATVDPTKRSWGVTAFLVDLRETPANIQEREKMGLRTVPFGDMTLEQVFVPTENRIGDEGAGAAIASSTLAVERAFLLAGQVGAMRRHLESSIAYAQSREQFGKPIGKYQSVANRIVDAKIALETSRLLLYQTVWRYQQGEPIQLDSALLKLHISESALEGGLSLLRNTGGMGYLTESGYEREMRDALGGITYSGTSDIQRVLAARLLGL